MCYYTLPFASEFSLAFLIEEEFCVAVSPAVPFHDLLPVGNKHWQRLSVQVVHVILKAGHDMKYQ